MAVFHHFWFQNGTKAANSGRRMWSSVRRQPHCERAAVPRKLHVPKSSNRTTSLYWPYWVSINTLNTNSIDLIPYYAQYKCTVLTDAYYHAQYRGYWLRLLLRSIRTVLTETFYYFQYREYWLRLLLRSIRIDGIDRGLVLRSIQRVLTVAITTLNTNSINRDFLLVSIQRVLTETSTTLNTNRQYWQRLSTTLNTESIDYDLLWLDTDSINGSYYNDWHWPVESTWFTCPPYHTQYDRPIIRNYERAGKITVRKLSSLCSSIHKNFCKFTCIVLRADKFWPNMFWWDNN